MVKFRPEIEPVVRLIEETPRDRALEVVIAQLKKGLSYKNLLAGLFLAGIRNIKPRPVGFKFHAVMVINSAHVLGQSSAVTERLLPLLWALDNFKSSQAQDVKEGDWVLGPVDESHLPKPHQAKEELVSALEKWDADAADAAVAALCRSSGAAETMEPLWRAGVRDQRDIGHKAIFTAQSWRTLQTIGWEHAEPVLRSLVFGMLDLRGDSRPRPVGPYEANLENAAKIRPEWTIGRDDPAATQALLQVIRQATPEAASAEAVKLLNQGIAPGSLWDAVILAACELLMHSPGIIAIHATTATNALHYIYTASGDDTTRRLALLQAVGWQPMYRGRVKLTDATGIDSLKASPDVQVCEWRRGRRRNLRDDQRRSQESRRDGHGLSGPRGFARSHLRRGPAHDLPQRPRQPRLQIWRGPVGGVPLVDRPQVAQPDGRGLHVQFPGCQDGRQPAHDPRARGARHGDELKSR